MLKKNNLLLYVLFIISTILISSCSGQDDTLKRIEGFNINNASEIEASGDVGKTGDTNLKNVTREPNQSVQSSVEPNIGKAQVNNENSIELNKNALELFEDKQYEEALDLYRDSIDADTNNYEARYNYAKALSILINMEYPGYFDMDYQIIEQLKLVLSINPEYIEMIKEEESFKSLENNYQYLELLGYNIQKTEDTLYILQHLRWYIRGGGIINIYGSLEFKNDDTFTLWYYTPDYISSLERKKDKYIFYGTYLVNSNEITLSLSGKMLKKRSVNPDIVSNAIEYDDVLNIRGIIQNNGEIKFDIFEYSISWQNPSNG